ncbi:MAG: hypothetical protein GY906_31400 [bacterium]|nr:hypothetical protein [bacterium]
MKRLGELLLDKGAIAVSELHTALEACRRLGGRLGTHLLKYGYVEEKDLLEALSEQFQLPFVSEAVLLKTTPEVLALVEPQTQQRALAVPFDLHQDRLQVAMANPRDDIALEELTANSGMKIDPYVTSESAIENVLRTLARDEDVEDVSTGEPARMKTKPVPKSTWESLWVAPRVGPEDLVRATIPRRNGASNLKMATFPGLAPMIDTSAFDEQSEIDEATYLARLREASRRDEVGDLFLRYASRYLTRLALFSVHKERVTGWMAHGEGVVVDDVQSFGAPLESPSVFRKMSSTGQPFHGALPLGPINDVLVGVLGDPAPLEVAGIPVRIKNRCAAFLIGDIPSQTADDLPIRDLVAAADRAGVALEILILKSKITK